MTRNHVGPAPAPSDDVSMWDDPQESAAVRQLLRAGRVDQVEYDVEVGLARHLANLQAGAPLPGWAVAQSTVQKGWSLSLLAWLLPPMISATVVGAWIYLRPAEPVSTPAPLIAASSPAAAASSVLAPQTPKSAPQIAVVPTPSAHAAVVAPQPSVPREIELASELTKRSENASAAGSLRNARHTALAHRVRPSHTERDLERARVGTLSSAELSSDSASATRGAAVAVATTPSPSPGPAAAPRPVAPAAQGAIEPQPQSVPAPVAKKEAPVPAAERRAEPEPARGSGMSDARLEREMQMLAVAQRVLTTDPERSLRLTRQGESEFRGSMFSAERTQVSLLALVQLGRIQEARHLGLPFLRAYPNAPWSARLREALATGRLPNR